MKIPNDRKLKQKQDGLMDYLRGQKPPKSPKSQAPSKASNLPFVATVLSRVSKVMHPLSGGGGYFLDV